MKRTTKQQHIDLIKDKLGDLLALDAISFEQFIELNAVCFWAVDQASKEVPAQYGLNKREYNDKLILTLISDYKLSFQLKQLLDTTLSSTLRLLVTRLSYVIKRLQKLRPGKVEAKFVWLLMKRIDELENKTLDVVNLLNEFEGCQDEEDLQLLVEKFEDPG